jgi:hypothetical protein
MVIVAQSDVAPVGSRNFLSRSRSTFAESIQRSAFQFANPPGRAVGNPVDVPIRCVGNQLRYYAQTGINAAIMAEA